MKQSLFFMVIVSFFSVILQNAAASEENYFTHTELQIHADYERKPFINDDIWTLTFEHVSEWKYGDNFFFLDIESMPPFRMQADTMYFEYSPRLSLDKIFNHKIFPFKLISEVYLAGQYNDGDKDFIDTVRLYGISFDFGFQPNFGFSQLSFYLRDQETQDQSWQLTFVWGQPFKIAFMSLNFSGFLDYWEDDKKKILITEPQLRFQFDTFLDKGSFMSQSSIGVEVEITHNFFGEDQGWEVNPTIFFAMPL